MSPFTDDDDNDCIGDTRAGDVGFNKVGDDVDSYKRLCGRFLRRHGLIVGRRDNGSKFAFDMLKVLYVLL